MSTVDPETPYPKMQAFPARHFGWHEVRCHHCRELGEFGFPARDVLESEPFKALCTVLDGVRGFLSKPVIVTSWYRCHDHPIELAKQHSGVHTHGIAADLELNRMDVVQAIESIMHTCRYRIPQHYIDIVGIGLKQKGDMRRRFVHVDVGGMIPEYRPFRGAVWTY